jgi:hypothetical protein
LSKRIGIIDADLLDNGTRHPNLALMKISAFQKQSNNEITLLENYDNINEFDQVFISKVFSFTKVPVDLANYNNIRKGGTGFYPNGGRALSNLIEHHYPDYHLYDKYIEGQVQKGKDKKRFKDYLNYSIGFATRGCFRQCDFCVNKKYDHVFRHASVEEFLNKDRFGIYLWDDNIFGYSKWESVFDELDETGKPFQFRQGLDIRLVTDKKARRLSKVKYHGDFIFAFDHIKDKKLIIRKLDLWRKYTYKTTKLYVLCAYESQDELDIANTFERIRVLMKFGCLPYIMRYESYLNSKFKGMYVQLARWCNQPQFFKKKSFREFCIANQDYHKNKSTYCASYKAMIDFEKKFPSIAKKYFDLRYEDEKR